MTSRRAFQRHKSMAKYRGVEWLLTFDEWWFVWNESGKWSRRGRRKGQYCMARLGPDVGPYAIGNVKIQLSSENVGDGSRGLKRSAEQNTARSVWMRGNTHCVGRRLSAATREQIRQSNIATKRRSRETEAR